MLNDDFLDHLQSMSVNPDPLTTEFSSNLILIEEVQSGHAALQHTLIAEM